MKLHFKFDQINFGPGNKEPMIDLKLNNHSLYQGPVLAQLDVETDAGEKNCLQIMFTNKEHSDTVCDSAGKIVNDMNFNLTKIVIDDHDLEELIWQGKYVSDKNEYPSCLFFGPAGQFVLNFDYPVLRWILKTRHDINQQDLNWEEDYNYYVNACKILNNL
jgi:hypothetical protein